MKNLGTIPSLEGYENYSITTDGKLYSHFTERFLKTSLRKGNGLTYEVIGLRNKSTKVTRTFSIHRLVCMGYKFVENHKELTVNHIDENPLNNNLENLEWMTAGDNVRYSQANKSYLGKPEKVVEGFESFGGSVKDYAEYLKVPYGTLYDVLYRISKVKPKRRRFTISKEMQEEIFKYSEGRTLEEVSKKFNISNSSVSNVKKKLGKG